MKIAINNLPLKSAHKQRGIGYYTAHLVEALLKDASLEIQQFSDLSQIQNADVVHYPFFDLFFHTLPIRKIFPTVVTIHDVIPLIFPDHYPKGLRGKLNFMLQKIALKSCNYIITDSKTSKNDLIKHLKVDGSKIAIVPLAADSKFRLLSDTKLLQVKRKYRLPDQFLLYVGDANFVKNLPFLIEGFRKLLKSPGLGSLKLALIGGVFLKDVENIDHPELESLKQTNRLIKEYGLSDNITRPGQIEDDELVAFYNLATIYVQPSLYEGFGLPLLQAFACGTPVIASNRGSLSEVGGESALYFDPTNIGQFMVIVRDLLEDGSLRSKLSKLGLKQAAKFSWEKVAAETRLIYFKATKKDV